MSSTITAPAVPQSQSSLKWLRSPLSDLMVGCGLWTIPMMVIAFMLGKTNLINVGFIFVVLSFFCNYPHYMATIYRAYGSRSDFSKYRFFTVYITVILVLTAVIVHFFPRSAPWFFSFYFFWSPYHYTGQNFGMAMMFARRNGAQPSRLVRNCLQWSFLSSLIFNLILINSVPSLDPMVMTLNLPFELTRPFALAALASFIGLGGFAIWRMALQTSFMRMIGPAMLLLTQAVWFVIPGLIVRVYETGFSPMYFNFGAVAFMHCAQYIWVTSYFTRREAEAGAHGGVWRPWRYYGMLILGGIALFVPGPWLVSRVFHFDLMGSIFIFQAVINLHHFLLDGAIWKLRDGKIASLLLGSGKDPMPGFGTDGTFSRLIDWFYSRNAAARTLRYGGAALLIAFAAVDLSQSYTLNADPRLDEIERAIRVNPYDTRLLNARALYLIRNSFPQEAMLELDRAIEINPYSADAQREKLRLLIQDNKHLEAFNHHQMMERLFVPDSGSRVLLGIAHSQLGRPDEALTQFDIAIKEDPLEVQAHVFAADLLLRRGEVEKARAHIDRFFERKNLTPVSEKGNALGQQTVLAHRIAGELDSAEGKYAEAVKHFNEARELCDTAGLSTQKESLLAMAAQAALRGGDASSAAEMLRQAIDSAQEGSDPVLLGISWQNYGQFLTEAGAPPDLRLACYLRAAAEFQAARSPRHEANILSFLQPLEQELAMVAARVRENREEYASRALAWRPV